MKSIITRAIAFIQKLLGTHNNTLEALTAANATIAEQSAIITQLRADVAANQANDAALEKAAADAKAALDVALARTAVLQTEIDDTNAAGLELAAVINAHEETPVVDSSFAITAESGVSDTVATPPPAAAAASAETTEVPVAEAKTDTAQDGTTSA